MNLESQACSLDLAKKLKALGVKQESAFYWSGFTNTLSQARGNDREGNREAMLIDCFVCGKMHSFSTFWICLWKRTQRKKKP